MKTFQKSKLVEAIKIDEVKCVNCHACIAACPIKYCNDGSGDAVHVNTDMCIACGSCLDACTHKARNYVDDFDLFLTDLEKGEKIVAIVAPAVAASFPNKYLNLNGWFKSKGVEFIYDVSFGAELTVKSYVEHLKRNKSQTIIAQPCPAIVTYIELYKPELIKYLAPADSPMMHSIKMMQNYYPEFNDHKIAIISPCIAKKREFAETGVGDYVVAFKSIDQYLSRHNIDLVQYAPSEFDNPKAERAVLFSTPGGLLKTAERWVSEISESSRKIEGVNNIYDYLEKLPKVIELGMSPLVVDCLSCEFGCNAGPVTTARGKSVDEIEYFISQRSKSYREHYAKMNGSPTNIENTVNKYWKKGLYDREYTNLWANVDMKYPNEQELNDIFVTMHKYSDEDIYNCVSCGYNTCEKMAIAIFNGLNKPENCHYYLQTEKDIAQNIIVKSERRVNNILETAHDGFIQIDNNLIIQQANMAFKTMVKRNDLVGRIFLEFLDAENEKILLKHWKLRNENLKSSYELTLTQTDGGKIVCLVSGAPMFNDTGEKIGSFAMISDITELKRAEIELQQSHNNLEQKVLDRTEELNEMLEKLRVSNSLIQNYNKELEKLSIVASEIDNATLIMDPEGNFEWVNAGFTKMFGITNDHLRGKNIISKSTPQDIESKILEGIKKCKPINYEAEIKRRGKPRKWIQATITPILDGQGKIRKLISIDTDITALKEKEFEILNQKEEIETQRDRIEKQHDIVKWQSDNIQDSITYARKIQDALLPNKDIFIKYFKDHLIFFSPKDIVSGDFYWVREKNKKVYVVSADCTGHGVPGAFMSMLGITLLNEIVNGHLDKNCDLWADGILNRLKSSIISAMNQTGKTGESRDGMDVAICVFDFENTTMQFGGANQSVLIVRDKKIIELKGDIIPVGIHPDEDLPFTSQNLKLEKDDQIYLFSDGITDQFNEADDKKFTKRRLKQLLLDHQTQSMKTHKKQIKTALENWRGKSDQVDDMLLIGLKV
ncbi:MAG: PAS domain S-box protein [Salinivirgaceae bacterium]|jgi:PAS domain S-box-containing protein|nr:PAS domain S-box protein [Salinivirgaceae bacterium]